MIYLFSPYKYAANDASMNYLFQIFGPMNGIIASPSSTLSKFQYLLPEMFKAFNSVILAVGALIVVYVTIVGIMNTAHEGQFMGKNWNNLWIPIRTVLGISMLVPSASGYSYIQIIMMWVIIQGIGAANFIWFKALSVLDDSFSPYSKIVSPTTEAKKTIDDLFQSLACAQTSALRFTNPYTNVDGSSASGNDNAYFCNVNAGNAACSGLPAFNPASGEYKMGPSGACGVFEVCNLSQACSGGTDSMACKACTAQQQAYTVMFPKLASYALAVAIIDYNYQLYYYRSSDPGSGLPVPSRPTWVQDYCTKNGISGGDCVGGKKLPSPLGDASSAPNNVVDEIYWPAFQSGLDDPQVFNQLKKDYGVAMDTAVSDFDAPATLGPELANAQSTGWIMAGSYYHTIARMNGRVQNDAAPSSSIVTDSDNTPSNPKSPLYHYRTNYDAAARLMAKAMGASSGGSASRHGGQVNRMAQNTASDIDGSAKVMWAPDNVNPVGQLTTAGYAIMFAIQIFYLGMIALSLIAGLTTIGIFVFGTGVDSPLESIWTFLFYFIVPLIWAAIGILMTIGATLGIYLPLVPYVIFTMGAVGWLFSTIEAMIAGPIVALGILSPSGHHEVLGEAKPALMLLFNIFLRPCLMIFGLIAAMLLVTVVATMVNAGFATVRSTVLEGVGVYGVNIIALILMLLAYVVIMVAALTKCFAAIYMVPEKVIRWIGGHGESYGEDAVVGKVEGSATQNAGTVNQALGKAAEAGSKIKPPGGGGLKGDKG